MQTAYPIRCQDGVLNTLFALTLLAASLSVVDVTCSNSFLSGLHTIGKGLLSLGFCWASDFFSKRNPLSWCAAAGIIRAGLMICWVG